VGPHAENIDAYCEEVRKLGKNFYSNIAADVLAKLGSTRAEVPADVFVQELYKPSIK
jgi:hypothetical protein